MFADANTGLGEATCQHLVHMVDETDSLREIHCSIRYPLSKVCISEKDVRPISVTNV